MKKYIFLFAALTFTASCSKSPKGTAGGATTCVCTYKKNPLKDTTVQYVVNPGQSITVDSQCNYHEAVLQSYAGKNGASCYLK